MPIYEYRCTACRKRVSVLTLRASESTAPTCDRCGSPALERLMSRFATVKSEDARLDSLADPAKLGGLDENDPKSMARWMRKMGRELGDEFSSGELDEMVDDLEQGAESECQDEGAADDGEDPV